MVGIVVILIVIVVATRNLVGIRDVGRVTILGFIFFLLIRIFLITPNRGRRDELFEHSALCALTLYWNGRLTTFQVILAYDMFTFFGPAKLLSQQICIFMYFQTTKPAFSGTAAPKLHTDIFPYSASWGADILSLV